MLRRQTWEKTPQVYTGTSDPTTSYDSANGYKAGDIVINTATRNSWYCVAATAGAARWRHVPNIIDQGGADAVAPNDTNENILKTITVPGNAMGANGQLKIASTWRIETGAGTNKTLRVRFGGIGGSAYLADTWTSAATVNDERTIRNKGATNSQDGFYAISQSYVYASGALVTSAVDTTADVSIVLTAQKATAGDSVTLKGWRAELYRPDIA